MVREILKWSDAKTKQYIEEDKKSSLAKCCGLGCLEGFIDGCAVVGAIGFVLTLADRFIPRKK